MASVTARLDHPPEPLWCIRFGSGEVFRTTRNHTLLTRRGWKRADRIRPGDQLPVVGNVDKVVVRGEPSGVSEPVYNLHTTGPHTFIIDGVVAHNFTVLRSIRTLWHRLRVGPWVGWKRFWNLARV